MTPLSQPLYQRKHPANQMDGVRLVREDAGVLRLRALRASSARLVLKSDAPLTVVFTQGAEARLRPGWDGTLGYAHYGLELSMPTAEYKVAFGEVRRAWRLAGAPDRVKTRLHDGPHRVNNAVAFEFLRQDSD